MVFHVDLTRHVLTLIAQIQTAHFLQEKTEGYYSPPAKTNEHQSTLLPWFSDIWAVDDHQSNVHQITLSSWLTNGETHIPLSADSHLDSDSDFP